MENYKKYIKNLRDYTDMPSFYQASQLMIDSQSDAFKNDYETNIIYRSTAFVVGPILTSYVLWILDQAVSSHINILYFLARDGKILKEIAEIFIKKYNLNIQCRYLYVSRYSLRKSLYCIAPQETMEYLCRDSLEVSPAIVLKRTGLSEDIQMQILSELGYTASESEKKYLSPKELKLMKILLQENSLFCSSMKDLSQSESKKIYQYFKDEGLTFSDYIAIVDSGWTGSMQRCIRQILAYNGAKPSMIGFYFGIQNETLPEDGIYNTFYFGPDDIKDYVLFNNNLFECWCMAAHGMTVGYCYNNDHSIAPILRQKTFLWQHCDLQNDLIKKYAIFFSGKQTSFHTISFSRLKSIIKPLLVRFMMKPDHDEAYVYGNIPFCDDMTEKYVKSLAERLTLSELFFNTTLVKIIYKFIQAHFRIRIKQSAWKEGTVAQLPILLYWIMRLDCNISYLAKFIIYLCSNS